MTKMNMRKILLRRDTLANWEKANPKLATGEIGFITDTNEFKIGNGTDDFKTLKIFKQSGTLVGKIDTTPDTTYHREIFNDYVHNKATALS